jgi:hypothetical protein
MSIVFLHLTLIGAILFYVLIHFYVFNKLVLYEILYEAERRIECNREINEMIRLYSPIADLEDEINRIQDNNSKNIKKILKVCWKQEGF